MKKYIILSVLALGLLINPLSAGAQTAIQPISASTQAALQAQINILLEKIKLLQTELDRQKAQPQTFCYTFTQNLRVGDKSAAVGNLHTILQKEGFSIPDGEIPQKDGETINDSRFGEATASAVSGFQEKYRTEILAPNGLPRGNGYVGPSTRAKLNALYGCVSNNNNQESFNLTSQVISQGDGTMQVTYKINVPTTLWAGGSPATRLFSWQIRIDCPAGVTSSMKGGGGCNENFLKLNGRDTWDVWFTNTTGTAQTVGATAQFLSERDGSPIATDRDALTLPAKNQNSQFSIKVLSPNGGEAYQGGSQQTIKWSAPPSLETVRIFLQSVANRYVGGGLNGDFPYVHVVLASDAINSGSYTVNIPHVSPGQYTILIEGIDQSKKVVLSDKSDGYFTITSANATQDIQTMLSNLISNWKKFLPDEPFYKSAYPHTIQFIGNNYAIVAYETHYNEIFTLYRYDTVSGQFFSQSNNEFTSSMSSALWNIWVKRYGDTAFVPITFKNPDPFATPVTVTDWKVVSENPFLK